MDKIKQELQEVIDRIKKYINEFDKEKFKQNVNENVEKAKEFINEKINKK